MDTAKNKPYYTSSLRVPEIAKIVLTENLTHLPSGIFAKRSRYDKGHFRHCPGYSCFCYILLKYVIFEQNLVFQVDISIFLHFGAKLKVQKTTKNHRFLEKFIFYIVISKYILLSPYVHIKQLHSYQNTILTLAEYNCLFLGKNINFWHFFTDFWKYFIFYL